MLFLSGLILGFIALTVTSKRPIVTAVWKIATFCCSVSCFYHFFK